MKRPTIGCRGLVGDVVDRGGEALERRVRENGQVWAGQTFVFVNSKVAPFVATR